MAINPGEIPGPRTEDPLLAEEPLPPGGENLAETVEEIDESIRSAGPDDVEQADRRADAAEGDADDAPERTADSSHGSESDASEDPTSDQGADPEDPEAQGEEPGAEPAS